MGVLMTTKTAERKHPKSKKKPSTKQNHLFDEAAGTAADGSHAKRGASPGKSDAKPESAAPDLPLPSRYKAVSDFDAETVTVTDTVTGKKVTTQLGLYGELRRVLAVLLPSEGGMAKGSESDASGEAPPVPKEPPAWMEDDKVSTHGITLIRGKDPSGSWAYEVQFEGRRIGWLTAPDEKRWVLHDPESKSFEPSKHRSRMAAMARVLAALVPQASAAS